MLFHLHNAVYQASIIAFEEKASKFDTLYFGYIKLASYRTWAYFTRSQVEHIKSLMSLYEEKSPLRNYSSGVHFSKKEALEKKHYLNTFLFAAVARFTESKFKTLDSTYLSKYLFSYWKSSDFYSWYLSDREEVVFKEAVAFPQKKIKSLSLTGKDYLSTLPGVKNLNELCSALIPPGADASFFKDFKSFFERHKLHYQYNHYEINFKLIKTCLFLRKYFTISEVKNFKTYHKLISFTFANFSCFKDFIMRREKIPEWEYCFKTLQGKSKVKTYLGWKFYNSRIKEMTDILKNLEPLNLPYYKHDSPQYAFNFYSKRYAQIQVEDFKLPNYNSYYEENYSTEFSQIKLSGFKVELVNTWRELEQIGIALHNCAGNFEKVDEYRRDVNFSIKNIKGEVLFLGTLRRAQLVQLKGFKNSAPPLELYQELSKQMKELGIIRRADSFKEACIQKYR